MSQPYFTDDNFYFEEGLTFLLCIWRLKQASIICFTQENKGQTFSKLII